jgi:outer membrane protein TolC
VASEDAVIQAKLKLARTRAQLTRAQADVFTSLVALNKALGGGWTMPEAGKG